MLKKFIFPFFLVLFFSSCGYTPIYLDSSEAYFEISSFKIKGNSQVNSIVKNKLKKYFNNNHQKNMKWKFLQIIKKNQLLKMLLETQQILK